MLAWVRCLMRKTSGGAISSFHPASITARQQVLDFDMHLLREALLFLGDDIAECRAALLVNRFWCAALERADPWTHLLRRDYPSLIAAGSIPPYDQQHQLSHRTAKDLLRFCAAIAKNESEEDWETQYLDKQFRNEHITLLFHHPTHGIVDESKIPLLPATVDDNDLSDVWKKLTMHRVLPLSEYEQYSIEWQMPRGLKLAHLSDLEPEAIDTGSVCQCELSGDVWKYTHSLYQGLF